MRARMLRCIPAANPLRGRIRGKFRGCGEVARENIRVDGGLLTAVRVAQNHQGVVRVVLDVEGVKDYTASLTNNPTQLLIDLYGNSRTATVRTAKAKRGEQADGDDTSKASSGESNIAAKSVQ